MRVENINQLELFEPNVKLKTIEDIFDLIQSMHLSGISDTRIIGAFVKALPVEQTEVILNSILQNRGSNVEFFSK